MVSVLVYVVALWGVGLGGGYVLAFNVPGNVPAALQGAQGYWVASTAGLLLAAAALTTILLWVLRQKAASSHSNSAQAVKPPAG